MIKGHPQVCLYRPEIPQNTGNIGRLTAGSGCRLHLVRPFGFDVNDKNLKRAGLDYWPFMDLEIHDELDELIDICGGSVAFLSKSAVRSYTQIEAHTKLLVFGQETKGLPQYLRDKYADRFFKIPMFHAGVRSFNLANSVSIVLFHVLAKSNLV